MKILFVASLQDAQSDKRPLHSQQQIQYGISYISSILKKHDHDTKLIVLCKYFGRKNRVIIDDGIDKFRPKLVCFTAVYSEYDFIAEVARYIKMRYPHIYLLIGGCHASLNRAKVLGDGFDALCVGEGEHPTLELVAQLEKGLLPSKISNLWIKNNREVEKNTTRPFLPDLDSLPFPDREIWQSFIDEQLDPWISVLAGRGCPFDCTYCCNHALKGLAAGPYVRFRSPDNILDEIKYVTSRFPGKKEIYLEVETFGMNRRWAVELCDKLAAFNNTIKDPLSFGANLRVTENAELEGLFAALKNANFRFINIGLESGSETLRRSVLNRYYTNQDVIDAVRLARKYGLKVTLYNMIGLPGERPDDFKETVNVNRICLPDKHFTSIFFPYPGTKLHLLCESEGLLKNIVTDAERRYAVLDLPGFTRKQIQKSYEWFEYYVYKGHKPLYKILARVAVSRLMSSPYLNILIRKLARLLFFKKSIVFIKRWAPKRWCDTKEEALD